MGVGAKHRCVLVVLADNVVADSHRLDVAVQIAHHRLITHVCPLVGKIHLVVHDPMRDPVALCAVSRGHVLKGGGVEIERLCSRQVRHGVVAALILRILEYGVRLAEDDGGHHEIHFSGPAGNAVNIVLEGTQRIVLAAIGVTGAFSRDVVIEDNIHRDAAHVHLLAVTEIKVYVSSPETFLVP